MKKMAVCRISDKLVINIIIADEHDLPPENTKLIEISDGCYCDIGWIFDGNSFVNPAAVQPESNITNIFLNSDDLIE